MCSSGSCNLSHGDVCWSSCKFTGKMPYRIYSAQRKLYDDCERRRAADAKKHGVRYVPLQVPSPADDASSKSSRRGAQAAAPVKYVGLGAGNAEAGGGMCDLFGTIAMTTIEHSFDDVHVDEYGDDDEFGNVPASTPPAALTSVKPLDPDPVGEWYAVPGGAKVGVRFVPLGTYPIMLAPYMLPGLNPVLCRSREVAEAKLHELQMSSSVMARHAAYLASSSAAAEVVRPRLDSGIFKYIFGAFAMVLALVTLGLPLTLRRTPS